LQEKFLLAGNNYKEANLALKNSKSSADFVNIFENILKNTKKVAEIKRENVTEILNVKFTDIFKKFEELNQNNPDTSTVQDKKIELILEKSEKSIVKKFGLVLLTNDTLYEMEESSDLGNTYNLLFAYLKSHQCAPIYFISMLISYFVIWNSLRKAHKIAAERLPKESKKVRLTLRTTKRRELTGYIFLFLNLACLLFFLMLFSQFPPLFCFSAVF